MPTSPIHYGGWRQETPDVVAALPIQRQFPTLVSNPNFVAKITAPTNGIVDLRPQCPPVYSQFEIGSCVANAIVADLEFLEMAQGMGRIELSRMFVYYNGRLEMNQTDQDNGLVISLAMGTLTKQGVATEATCPYDTSKVFLRPDWNAYREAFAHTIVQSYRIMSTGGQELCSDIQTALMARHPVVFGTPVWKSLEGVGSDGNIPMPDNSPNIGGHGMLIVGFDLNRQVYIIRNSWDVTWGASGYAYMPFSYLDAAGASDFWCGTKIG